MFRLLKNAVVKTGYWIHQMFASSIIFAILIFIIVNFYVFSSIVNLNTFFFAFLLLSLLTDGFFILTHLPRRTKAQTNLSFSPKKLSVVIACYNGEDVIAETIKQAAKHVPKKQIIVVSDASTDRTNEIVKASGATLIVNKVNLNKVASVNVGIEAAKTPYVLILDDDTLIGDTFIPTSLLDDGYAGVAFNVMPTNGKTLINELQQLEYRSTMQLSKHLRAKTGAIGNISGAIGLYRTDDLKRQITMHSGQFAGEDEQRTLLAHIYSEGKGITYTDSLVLTIPPSTWRELFRQRAFSWSLSLPEQLPLYLRILFSPRYHYLLKAEKAYLIYIFVTEPLRILFLWTLVMKPQHLALAYGFYAILNVLIWARLGFKDTLRAVVLSPFYSLWLMLCRFIGYFYWLKVKGDYLVKRLHRHVVDRALLAEYALTFLIIASSWVLSIQHFRNEMHLFNKIRTENLDSKEQAFNYDPTYGSPLASSPVGANRVSIIIEPGDTIRALAHKAVDKYATEHSDVRLPADTDARWRIDMQIAQHIPATAIQQPNTPLNILEGVIRQAITDETQKAASND
jgi:glycosyltransferase involved in cell wall biosynthesis